MATPNYLAQIKKRMDSIQKEYDALAQAYQLLSSANSGSGRKSEIPSLSDLVNSKLPVSKKNKRGRPSGAKSKVGSKKPGPKSKIVKPSNSAKVVAIPPAKKVVVAAKKVAKKVVAKQVKKSSKGAAKVAVKKVGGKPAKSSKRGRIPNLSEMIVDIVAKGGRFATNAQITDKLVSYYPGKKRSDLGKYISVILSNMKARKELDVVTIDARGNKMRSGLWGIMKWFDNGKPKVEYLK